MKNCWDFIKCYWMLLLGVISIAIGTGLYMYQYISSSMDIKNDCIFKWSLSLNMIGLIAIAIFIICRYCCEKSNNPTNTQLSSIQSYIDNLTTLKNKYKCARKGQYVVTVILLLAILSFVLIPRIMVWCKTGLISSSGFSSFLFDRANTFNITNHDQITLFWNSIYISIIFIILCILFLSTIHSIRITSYKIRLIDSTIARIQVYNISRGYGLINIPVIGIKKNDVGGNDYSFISNDRFIVKTQDGQETQESQGIQETQPKKSKDKNRKTQEKQIKDKDRKIQDSLTNIITTAKDGEIKFEIIYLINDNKWVLICNNQTSDKIPTDVSDETKKKIELEINRLTQELNADSSRNIWSAIFNSR